MEKLTIYVKELVLEDIDVLSLADLLQAGHTLIYPRSHKKERVTLSIGEGSTILDFHVSDKKATQNCQDSLDSIELTQNSEIVKKSFANALRKIKMVSERIKSPITIGTSRSISGNPFYISEETTIFNTDLTWCKTKIYLYGEIQTAGGASESNIHLKTRKYKTVIVSTPQKVLATLKENPVYRKVGIEVSVFQCIETGEIKGNKASFIRFLDYNPIRELHSLDEYIKQQSSTFENVKDSVSWVRDLRGAM